MTLSYKSGPVFSNISMIKRALHQSAKKSLSQYEITRFLANHWGQIAFEDAEQLVNLALHAKLSHFKEADETGLWSIKYQEQSDLEHIYEYLKASNRLLTGKQLLKRAKKMRGDQLLGQLMSDLRFSSVQFNGDEYWLLSECEFVNDLIYNHMQNSRFSKLSLSDVSELLLNEYELREGQSIFAPEIDPRFRLIGASVLIEVQEQTIDEDADIPVEIKEEVARSSLLLCKYLKSVVRASAKDVAVKILGVRAYDKMLGFYCRSINEFFETLDGFKQDSHGAWLFGAEGKDLPDIIFPPSWKYAVYNSFPDINFIHQQGDLSVLQHDSQAIQKFSEVKNRIGKVTRYLSYYERVKGYLRLPNEWDVFLDERIGRVRVVCREVEYLWSFRNEQHGRFFYGGGVMDCFFDHGVEVGREITMQYQPESNGIKLDLGGLSEQFASEQSRYLDIGLLVEESRSVNKSFFVLMCEVLASYPSGMHWVRLYEKVNAVRSASRNTITQLLSRNPCFEVVTGRKGYWHLNSSKLSRFFLDEEGNQHDKDENNSGYLSPIIEVRDNSRKSMYVIPMLQHWDNFNSWANKQKNMKFETIQFFSKSEAHQADLVVKAYAKMLCKLAFNRNMYSVDHMDLIQEGFFGLSRAVELFSVDEKVPFGQYAKTHVLSRMLRKQLDSRTLVRFPIHVWEQIRNLELDENAAMQQCIKSTELYSVDSEIHKLQILARWKNVDYISFEQYWSYLSENIDNESEPEWTFRELLDEKTLLVYASDSGESDEILLRKLENSCDIQEQDSEQFWDLNNAEYLAYTHDLQEKISRIFAILKEREIYVLERRFGLNGHLESTLEEIAINLECTRERVRQIEGKALKKLLKYARKSELDEYLIS
jgi:RNA polymerase primary sigma factor